ncbi:MAG: hypothetical protein AB1758_38330 [Candidatus Eremiobacterota bacterium]
MKRLFLALLAVLAGWLPASAAPPGTATVQVQPKSDRVEIVVTSSAPFQQKQKMVNPGLLLVELSPAQLKPGSPRKIAVDKGLIQTVELEQRGTSVVLKLSVISRPKVVRQAPDQGGRKLTLAFSTVDIHVDRPAGFGDVVARPAAARPVRPTPAPSAPALPVRPVVSEAPAPAPAPPTPAPVAVASGPRVRLVCQDMPLDDVLGQIAAQVGLNPQIDPSVSGSFTGTLNDVPLQTAVETVLQGQPYTYRVLGNILQVLPGEASVSPAVEPGGLTPAAPVVATGPVARDYFPIKEQKAAEIVEHVRSLVPNVTYSVDARLNIIIAEGSPEDIDKLGRILANVSAK